MAHVSNIPVAVAEEVSVEAGSATGSRLSEKRSRRLRASFAGRTVVWPERARGGARAASGCVPRCKDPTVPTRAAPGRSIREQASL